MRVKLPAGWKSWKRDSPPHLIICRPNYQPHPHLDPKDMYVTISRLGDGYWHVLGNIYSGVAGIRGKYRSKLRAVREAIQFLKDPEEWHDKMLRD